MLEVNRLSAIGADSGSDQHQPGKHLRPISIGLIDHESTGLLRKKQQDGGRIEQHGIPIGKRWRFCVGVDREERGIESH
jgi:hypothetical protein